MQLTFTYARAPGLAQWEITLPSGRTLTRGGPYATWPLWADVEIVEEAVDADISTPAVAYEAREVGRGAGRPTLVQNSYWEASGHGALEVATHLLPRLEELAVLSATVGQQDASVFVAMAWTLEECQAVYGHRYTAKFQQARAAERSGGRLTMTT